MDREWLMQEIGQTLGIIFNLNWKILKLSERRMQRMINGVLNEWKLIIAAID